MKVGELIEQLQEQPPEMPVFHADEGGWLREIFIADGDSDKYITIEGSGEPVEGEDD